MSLKKSILKKAGVTTEKEFYKKYPSKEAFLQDFPDFELSQNKNDEKMKYATGGQIGTAMQTVGSLASLIPIPGMGLLGGGLNIMGSLVAASEPVPVQKEVVLGTEGAKRSDPYRVMRKGGKLPQELGSGFMKPIAPGVSLAIGPSHENGGIDIGNAEIQGGELVIGEEITGPGNGDYVARKSVTTEALKKLKTAKSAIERDKIFKDAVSKNEALLRKENSKKSNPKKMKKKYFTGGPLSFFGQQFGNALNQYNQMYGDGPEPMPNLIGDPLNYMANLGYPDYNKPKMYTIPDSYVDSLGAASEKALDPDMQTNLRYFQQVDDNRRNSRTPYPNLTTGNTMQLLGGLAAPIYNAVKGNQPAQKIRAYYNPNEGKITSTINKTKIDPTSIYNRNAIGAATAQDNVNQITSSANVRRAAGQSIFNSLAQQNAEIGMNTQIANSQLNMQKANVLDSLGQQRVNANSLRQQLQLTTDATKDAFKSTAASQFGQSILNTGIAMNQDKVNAYQSGMLSQGLQYTKYNPEWLKDPYGGAPMFLPLGG